MSNHDTKDCNTQKQGLTTVDPSNQKYQVLKTTGEHFTSRARTPLPNNSSGKQWQLAIQAEQSVRQAMLQVPEA